MGFNEVKGINLSSGFKYQAQEPLDLRTKVDTVEDRNALVAMNAAYPGLQVFVTANKTSYIYDGTNWVEVSKGTAYTHPTTSGYKHIPAGGSSGQFLKWSADGTAVWAADNNTTYTVATTTADGLMSAADKSKLDGVAVGANKYVHPTGDGNLHVPATSTTNSGKVLKAGSTAGSVTWGTLAKGDVGLSNVDNTSDLNKPVSTATQTALNNKVDKVTGKVLSTNDFTSAYKTKLDNIAENANNYVHPTTAGNKHIPSGGAAGQFLKWTEDGTAEWAADNNTTYGVVTTSTNGLMSSAMLTKLNGIAEGANNYTHPTSAGNKHIPSGGTTGQILRWSADGTAVWGADNNTTYVAATQTTDGLMSAADKKKLDGVAANANNYTHPSSHPATMITEDATHRFVSDTEKTNWNNKYTKSEVDNLFSSLETNIDWKESVATLADIEKTYPNPVDGWTVNVKDTDYTYRYNGTSWVAISANAIPKATTSVDGLMTKELVTKLNGIATNANNYVHPTSSGNKHIPAGGSSGQFLKWSADGTAVWAADNNTTYGVVTTTANGLMTPALFNKLNGIAESANNYVHPSTSGNKHIPSGGASGQILRWSADGTATWGADNNTTYGIATTSTAGLVKSGTDITVDSSGNVSVNDNSHNHTIANVTNLQGSLDSKRPIKRAMAGQNSSTATNPWYKVAAITITAATTNSAISFKVSTGNDAIAASRSGILTANVRTNTTKEFEVGKLIWEYAGNGIDPAKFVLAYKSTANTNTVFEIWANIDSAYTVYAFEVISEHNIDNWTNNWSVYNTVSAGSQSAITSGYTSIPSTLLTLKNVSTPATHTHTPSQVGVIGTAPTSGQVAVFDGTTGKIKSTGYTIAASVPSGAKFTDTTYSVATTSANGLMAAADKTKLDGIATGANNYVHPTTSGNKHIPSGGSSGQFLKWSADGTATWAADNNTTYTVATQSANGLMSAADKAKLDGVAANANNYTHPSTHAASMITQDSTHRFVSDTEKNTWNAKANIMFAETLPTTAPAGTICFLI